MQNLPPEIFDSIIQLAISRDDFPSVSALLKTLEQRGDLRGYIQRIHATLMVRIEKTCHELSRIIGLATNCRDISVQAHWKPGVEDPITAAIGRFPILENVRLTGVHDDGPNLRTIFEHLKSTRVKSLHIWPYENRYSGQVSSYNQDIEQIWSENALCELLPQEIHGTANLKSLEVHYPCKNQTPTLRALLC